LPEILKAVLLGVIQGITEWLPVSSTGHMILFDAFLPMNASSEFRSLFLVAVQLFSVLAVLFQYKERLFSRKGQGEEKGRLWLRIVIGAFPAAVVGLFLDEFIEGYLYTPIVVAAMLILYGIVLLLVEKTCKSKTKKEAEDLEVSTILKIGCFQTLALVPGTSRSGATIAGGMLSGVDRSLATEFSFLLSIPVMLGASALRIGKYFLSGDRLVFDEWIFLFVGGFTAFLVSLLTVRFLTAFVKKHSFFSFAVYRILLGIILLFLFV